METAAVGGDPRGCDDGDGVAVELQYAQLALTLPIRVQRYLDVVFHLAGLLVERIRAGIGHEGAGRTRVLVGGRVTALTVPSAV